MDLSQTWIDVIRAAHLVCFGAGMGTGVYFDFQKLRTLKEPLTAQDVRNLSHLHAWISLALAGLWVSGLVLIYVRTSFEFSEFSPKLWLKVGLMVLMTLNSIAIGRVVIPMLKAHVSRPLVSMPIRQLMAVTQIGVLSMCFWMSGLILGSSVFLKTAPWDVLVPIALGWFALATLCGQAYFLVVRKRAFDSSSAGRAAGFSISAE